MGLSFGGQNEDFADAGQARNGADYPKNRLAVISH
jgi:hypothetical protein